MWPIERIPLLLGSVRQLTRQLVLPIGRLPGRPAQQLAVALLNQAFAAAIAAGDLEFFTGQSLRIHVEDIAFELHFGFDGRRLQLTPAQRTADVGLCGDTLSFLRMLSRREDPDTLFFQRRLRIEGQVELGLAVKNFLAAWEPPYAVEQIERLCGWGLQQLERNTRPESLRHTHGSID